MPGACAGSSGSSQTPASGEVGVWENVTPDGIDFEAEIDDNFGIQDVLVDPVRPSDVYAFVCRWGVWKSTDYGSTFSKVSTGTGAADIEAGKPWGAGIDTNPCRDPSTPPTLYTFSGRGSGRLLALDRWRCQLDAQPGPTRSTEQRLRRGCLRRERRPL